MIKISSIMDRIIYQVRRIVGLGGWHVVINGHREGFFLANHFNTQQEAHAYAQKMANEDKDNGQLAEVKIQGEGGRIRDSDTYGCDPHNIPG